MSSWNIENEEKPKPEDVRYLIGRLQEFNETNSPSKFGRKDVRLFLRDENGLIQAGLLGNITMHSLVIQILWVEDLFRGKGVGRELVRLAEEMATIEDAKQAIVETTTFQAPGFYEKLGYACICEIPDCPVGASSWIMRKLL